MPAVWGYARVSREDQALALQLDALEAAGVLSANIVQEKESGARQRPAFESLLKRLKTGDSLFAWKVDRLGRDALAALTVARDLDARGVRIVITTLGVDSSTPAGRMVFGVLAQLAEFERATLIEEPGPAWPRRRNVVGALAAGTALPRISNKKRSGCGRRTIRPMHKSRRCSVCRDLSFGGRSTRKRNNRRRGVPQRDGRQGASS